MRVLIIPSFTRASDFSATTVSLESRAVQEPGEKSWKRRFDRFRSNGHQSQRRSARASAFFEESEEDAPETLVVLVLFDPFNLH